MKAVYAVANRKGGTGKSTTAHALGTGLSARGYKVLLVDIDPQGNLSDFTGADQSRHTVYNVLKREITAEEAIQHTDSGDIIPATSALVGADLTLTEIGKEYRLKEALETVKRNYDYVIIDVAPALNVLTINALTACTSVIVTASCDTSAIKGAREICEASETVKQYCNNKLRIEGILMTQYNSRAVLTQTIADTLGEYAAQYRTRLFKTKIRSCQALREAAALQQSIYDYAPRSNAVQDYNDFINELIGERR